MKLPALIPAEEMDFPAYLGDPMPEPSLTSSLVKDLLSTAPRKVWQNTKRLNKDAQDARKTEFDLGTAAHAMFTGSGEPIVVIDAADFRSKAAKEQREQAYALGKTPILKKDMARVDAMATAALEQFGENPDIGKFFNSPMGAETLREATIMWSEAGAMHRCRPDFYHLEENVVIHYKTTGVSISPNELSKYAANMGWYLTAAHYAAGAKMLTGNAPKQYFAVQETTAPHLCIVAELDATFMANAEMRRARAITIWAKCLRENNWPGFPNRTVKLECPEWLERNLIADKDAEQDAINNGTDLLEMARAWSAPDWQPPATMITADELFSDEVTE